MSPPVRPMATVALLLLLQAASIAADSLATGCSAVPNVAGVNQEASRPEDYGKCTNKLDSHVQSTGSNWCAFGKMGFWPAGPSRQAKQCMKFGRMTVYRGPVYGSQADQKGACNAELVGSNTTAIVAVSTKYLKTAQGGWVDDKGACGKCMCIHVRAADDKYNPGLKYFAAKKYFGLTFMGKVGDRCGECEDDHIDVLMDRPFSYAPWTPSKPKENEHAQHVNAIPGLRGFGDAWAMRGGDYSPETTGTWVSDWQWVPCDWDHAKCGTLMKGMGYEQVFTPQATVGVDSATMKRTLGPNTPVPWSVKVARKEMPMPKAELFGMCGGMGDGCKKVATTFQCEDKKWAICPDGSACKRDSQWWWSCQTIPKNAEL